MTGIAHVSHNSGNDEWYTPAEVVDAARAVMGGIDLDPASTELANTVVKANTIYTVQQNALWQSWEGRVYMNPPYSANMIGKFVAKLVTSPNITEAVVLVNNATETGWFSLLVEHAAAICLLRRRVRFWGPNGTVGAPLQGQIVAYVGANVDTFKEVFSPLGSVLLPYRHINDKSN